MTSQIIINIGSNNWLTQSRCWTNADISVKPFENLKFASKYQYFHLDKCIGKSHVQNNGHFIQVSSGYSRLISHWTKRWCGLLPPQMTTPWCYVLGFIWRQHTEYDTHESFMCVAVKRYPRSAALGAHPENIVHGDGIPMTSVAGPVGGLQIWPGTIP